MKTLAIDIETYSSVDLKKSGVYKYVESPDFSIILFAYAYDDDEITVIDLASGEDLPVEIFKALTDCDVLKVAYNAQFERLCINKHFALNIVGLMVEQWECTKIKASMLGMPSSLAKVAEVLNLSNQKMKSGKASINYFSKPCKATMTNGGRTRNLPHHDVEKWESFKKYCIMDVQVERDIRKKIAFFEIPEKERELYVLDQEINDTGTRLSKALIENAVYFNDTYTSRLSNRLKEITKLDNPGSVAQLKKWIFEVTCIEVKSLSKNTIPDVIAQTGNQDVVEVLELRQKLAKTSVKKYEAMDRAICEDGRVRGLLQFYGANRTGRWAGRLVQVQNLPKNKIPDLDMARNIVLEGDLDMLELLYGNVADILSQLIRTTFIASEKSRFIVADFSAIEARVIAWLAGEKWRLEVFKTHGKIYEASASQMFKVPLESIGKSSPLRQKGKVSELALGYQGGPGALIAMGALDMGIEDDELKGIVDAWRSANPKIKKLWKDIQKAAIKAVEEKVPVKLQYGLTFYYRKGFLFIKLPSGRRLSYMRATLEYCEYGKRLVYESMDQTTKTWKRISTYGGKLTENIIQAIARDCLRESMLKLRKEGFTTVIHVHDEFVLDTPFESNLGLEKALEIMAEPIDWAPGLLLKGEGYETEYYFKD